MRRRHDNAIIATVAALTLCAAIAPAQEWAQQRLEETPRHLEWVDVEHDGRTVECFLAYPERADKAPAVIVIHEIFGLTDWVRGVADQLAERGYLAIAPDLLSGAGPDGGGTASLGGRDAAVRAIRNLPAEQITADLNAVAEFVTKLPSADGAVSVAGFCWGGRQTFRYATNNPNLKAACVFYGQGPTDETEIARIACPVHGFYGQNDNRVNATIENSKLLLQAAGKTYEPVIYDGAGHGFMRAGEAPDASEANAAARKAGWLRLEKILASE